MKISEYLKNIKPVFKNSKVGDKTFHIFYGWGTIIDFEKFKNYTSVIVEFHEDTFPGTYKYYLDGREFIDQINPTIYLKEILLENL